LLLDRNYAAAWTILGLVLWEEAFNGWSENPEASLNLAIDAAARSRSIDDSNPDTYALLTWIHLSLRKYDEAFELAEQAMALGQPRASRLARRAQRTPARPCGRIRASLTY
jgi:tetratricopeptide (TPR) repeat protein